MARPDTLARAALACVLAFAGGAQAAAGDDARETPVFRARAVNAERPSVALTWSAYTARTGRWGVDVTADARHGSSRQPVADPRRSTRWSSGVEAWRDVGPATFYAGGGGTRIDALRRTERASWAGVELPVALGGLARFEATTVRTAGITGTERNYLVGWSGSPARGWRVGLTATAIRAPDYRDTIVGLGLRLAF